MNPLIVLDRDGVINEDRADFVKSVDEWVPIDGSIDAIARLTRAGWIVTVATNQSGVGRGIFDLRSLHDIHLRMHEQVRSAGGRIEAVFYCPHAPDAGCGCRKPQTGLFREISRRFGCDLESVPAVGDASRDLEAARSAGARPVLVLTGKGTQTLEELDDDAGILILDDLASVADRLLA